MLNKDNAKFFRSKDASEKLVIHTKTLYLWESKGIIEVIRSSPKDKRFYNVEKYMNDKGITCYKKNKIEKKVDKIKCVKTEDLDKENMVKICYARVSSVGQKDDLTRQKQLLKEKYPTHYIIEDIGSGINFTKKGLLKIIELSIEGKLEELVVVHKDRLARFGYELIEFLIKKYSNGKITIINKEENMTQDEEMVKDVLQIMNVFVAKMNGKRKYTSKKNNNTL